MHVSDIDHAIAGGHTSDLEEAFAALVLYPGYARVEGAESANGLADLLDRVAHALRGDNRTMPAELADTIHGETGDGLTDRTFAAGARAVRVYAIRWRGFFAQHFVAEARS